MEPLQKITALVTSYQEHDLCCLQQAKEKILARLKEHTLTARIFIRLKDACSIYEKMRLKQCDFLEIHDRLGMRIIVPCEHDCYKVLGVVHTILTPVRTKDYIHMPKENGYRAIHTVVAPACSAYEHQMIEIQISSTANMRRCGHGVLKHTKYKNSRYAAIRG